MRRILLLMAAVLCITVASAQEKGETTLGAQVVYGSGDGLSNIGIGAEFQWNVINNLRLAPSFTYFLKKDMSACGTVVLMYIICFLFPILSLCILWQE